MGPWGLDERTAKASLAPARLFIGLVLLTALAGCSDAAGPDGPGSPEPARYAVRIVASAEVPIDSAVVRIEGPTSHTLSVAEGGEVLVDSLAPGVYQVALEGWRDESVAGFTEFEETFEAGERQEHSVTFERAFAPEEASATLDAGLIELQWDSVPGAVEYVVEAKASAEAAESVFEGRTEETSLQLGPFEAGAYTVLIQAVDRFGNGGQAAEMAMTIEPERFPVTVQVEEGAELPGGELLPVGSVVSEPDGILCGGGNDQCQAEFPAGEEVVLKLVWPGVPQGDTWAYGTGFGGWTGDCAGLESCVLEVDGPKEVVATGADELARFDLQPFILSSQGYSVPGHVRWRLTWEEGGGTCEQYILFNDGANSSFIPGCHVWVAPGTRVTIASPVGPVDWMGWPGWGGGTVDWCESVQGDTCRVVVPPGYNSMYPVWDWAPPQGHSLLQVVRSDLGLIQSDVGGIYQSGEVGYPVVCGGVAGWNVCSQVYPDGTRVTLTAEPVEGYRLTGWTGAECSGTGPCEITMDEWTRVEASFEPITLGTGFGLEQFSPVPAGTFQMGGEGPRDERPVHTVNLTRDFYLQRTEVTQAQWREVMGENTSRRVCDLCPVDHVSWDDIQTFLARLNAEDPDAGFRLPTEAEWEYAARAGTTGDFGGTGVIDEMGWYSENAGQRTRPVALKFANAWGLYDMHGNVKEWVHDRYSESYYGHSPTDDPVGPSSSCPVGPEEAASRTGCFDRGRVLRGGSWGSVAKNARSATRGNSGASWAGGDFGFRLARSR